MLRSTAAAMSRVLTPSKPRCANSRVAARRIRSELASSPSRRRGRPGPRGARLVAIARSLAIDTAAAGRISINHSMEQVAVMPTPARERVAARPAPSAVGWYAAGSVGTGAYGTVPGLVLLYFMTNVLGVAPALAGAALVVPKLVDVVLHPLVGLLADRGHARRLVTTGALLLPLLFVALFAVPASLTGARAALYVAALLVAPNLAFSCFQVPYVAAPAAATDDTHERTRLVGWRMAALIAGMCVSGARATALADPASGERGDYRAMAVVVAVTLAAALLGGRRGMARLPRREAVSVPPPLR